MHNILGHCDILFVYKRKNTIIYQLNGLIYLLIWSTNICIFHYLNLFIVVYLKRMFTFDYWSFTYIAEYNNIRHVWMYIRHQYEFYVLWSFMVGDLYRQNNTMRVVCVQCTLYIHNTAQHFWFLLFSYFCIKL